MPKYYIKSGQIKFILNRDDYEQAILHTLKHYRGKGRITGPKICISEVGFDSFKLWKCYDTDIYLQKLKDGE